MKDSGFRSNLCALLAFLLIVQTFVPSSKASNPAPASVVLVDDFNEGRFANHLGGIFGAVAQGGDATIGFSSSSTPYLAQSSSLKFNYQVKNSPGYAFLWMKLGKSKTSPEVTEYLDLNGFTFLSFKYHAKRAINFKVELHEDLDGDGRYVYEKDRSGSVYIDSVKTFELEDNWFKVLIPLKRYTMIKDWSKILEIVYVFEKDRSGEIGEVLLDDIFFIPQELKKTADTGAQEFLKDVNWRLNGQTPIPAQRLSGSNQVEITYNAGGAFNLMESLSLEIKSNHDENWVPAATKFAPSATGVKFVWETYSFNPPDSVSIRLVVRDFFGNASVVAGPVDQLSIAPMTDEQFLDYLEYKTYLFFDQNQDPDSGLFYDTTGGGDASIAVTGFGLSALVIGAERGWISKGEAKKRVKHCLKTFVDKIKDKEGFYYHFINPKTLERAGTSELSTVDTALLLAGVLTAGEYFGGDVKKLAHKLYKNANWDFFVNHHEDEENFLHFHHGWTPEEGLTEYFWDYYTDETILLVLMGMGSPTHPVPDEMFYRFVRRKGEYKDVPPFVYTWHGGLFSYQYAHAWFKLHGLEDKEGVDWFENTKNATLANRHYVIDYAGEYKTYGEDTWGITSMRLPDKYVMHYGPLPNGQNKAVHDGTVSPSAPGGSMPFTPYYSLRALKNFYQNYPETWGFYGFKDSINLDRNWVSPIYYGLGQGIILLAIENFRTGLVWNQFMKNKWMQEGVKKAKLKAKTKEEAPFFDLEAFKKKLAAAPVAERVSLLEQALNTANRYEEVNGLALLASQTLASEPGHQALLLTGRIQAKALLTLQESDLELGRLYLKAGQAHAVVAQNAFERALAETPGDIEKLEVFRDQIAFLRTTQNAGDFNKAQKQLSAVLREGIRKNSFNLAWALKWADQMDDETAFRLRQDFFADLDAKQRETLMQTLQKKSKEAFRQGDFRKVADLYDEQIRFLEAQKNPRAIVSFLQRAIRTFQEAGKFTEAERFYRVWIDKYASAQEGQRAMLMLADMLEKKGDRERSLKEYETFVEKFSESKKVPDAMMRMANLYSALEQKDKAIQILKTVGQKYASTPYEEEALYLTGMIYFHSDRYTDAIRTWEDFLKRFPATRKVSVVKDYLERADQKEAAHV